MSSEAIVREIAGRELKISSPDKTFFSKQGQTKLDLIEYYEAVEGPLLATMGGRPTLMQRFPDGASGKSFFQKRVPKGAPDWLETTVVSTPNGTTSNAMVATDLAHIAWAAQMGCLGFHPWPYQAANPAHTDELRIDLDPSPGVDFEDIRTGAKLIKEYLDELGLTAYPKTTGSRGLHLFMRLVPEWDGYQVRPLRWPWPASLNGATPNSSRRLGGKRSEVNGSSSTSTRTHHTRRCLEPGACGPEWGPKSAPRSSGTR